MGWIAVVVAGLLSVWNLVRFAVLYKIGVNGAVYALIPFGYEYKVVSEAWGGGNLFQRLSAVILGVGFLLMWGIIGWNWAALLMFGGYVLVMGASYCRLVRRAAGDGVSDELLLLCMMGGALEVVAWALLSSSVGVLKSLGLVK